MTRVVVAGAGVIGLSCAVRLAEAGYDTHVLARDLPLETTSAVAAALWYPYRAFPADRVAAWSATSYAVLAGLARRSPASGVTLRHGTELLREPAADPWWRSAVPDGTTLTHPDPATLPAGYRDAWRLVAPVVDMADYLPWLVARLEAAGGTLTRHWLGALPTSTVVVSCVGLAARRLAGDASVTPVRGQVVRLERPHGFEEWLLDSSGPPDRPLYVVPRTREVVVGGTAEEGSYDRDADPGTARELLEWARALVPALADARVLGHRVGLRPARPEVRLEVEHRRGAPPVVHCYGHGGAGVTLSWGCAEEVLALVRGLEPTGRGRAEGPPIG